MRKLIIILKKYWVECIVGIVLVFVLALIAILTFRMKIVWTGLNNVSSIVGLITAVFAFLAWANTNRINRENRKKKTGPTEVKKTDAALVLSSGTTEYKATGIMVCDYLKQDKNLNGLMDNIFEHNISDKLVELPIQDKYRIFRYKDKYYDTPLYDIGVYFYAHKKSEDQMNKKSEDQLKRIIQIHFEKMPEKEKEISEFLQRYNDIIVEVKDILSMNSVGTIHVFSKVPVIIPFILQEHFSNNMRVMLYHYVNEGYVYAGQIQRREYLL